MKSIRIGNDISIKWPIVLSGDVASLTDLHLSIEVRPSDRIVDYKNYVDDPAWKKNEGTIIMNGGVYCPPDRGDGKERCRPRPPHNDCRPAPIPLTYTVKDNVITAIWPANKQFATGEYDILLYANKDKGGQAVVDQYRFVRLVAHTAQADDTDDDDSVGALIEMQPTTLELSGLSAYEVAVINGFKGTEKEWLASLRADIDYADLSDNLAKRVDATVNIGELDSLVTSSNVADVVKGNKTARYVVMSSDNSYVEGILEMFGDSMGHMVTQVFITHDIYDAESKKFSSHTDDQIHRYFRSYHVQGGTTEIPVNTWGDWKPLLPDLQGAAYLGIATPTTTPADNTAYENAFYIATEAGTYINFKDYAEQSLSLADGEVAVFSTTPSTGSGIWSKAVLDVAHKSALQKVVTGVSKSDKSDSDKVILDVYNTFKDSANPVSSITLDKVTESKAGVMAASDKKNLEDLVKDVWPLSLSFTASPMLSEYTGSEVQITLSWTAKRRGADVTPTSISVKQGSRSVYSGTANPGTARDSNSAKGTTKYDITVEAEGLTASASVSVQQLLPMYFGFDGAAYATDLTITDLTKQTIKTSPAGTYTLTNSTSGNYMWLCVPDTMTINKVTLNGFDVPMEAAQTKSTSLGSYKCYRSSNALLAQDFTIVVS